MGLNMKTYQNYDKYPEKQIVGHQAVTGWEAIRKAITTHCGESGVVVVELYPGVNREEVGAELAGLGGFLFDAESCTISHEEYHHLIAPFLTDDRVFGIMNTLTIPEIYDNDKIENMREKLRQLRGKGPVVIYGTGASLVADGDLLIYLDMPRWEIQCRFQRGMANWKTDNGDMDTLRKFKQGFFVEWRMADRLKRRLFDKMDFIVETIVPNMPKMVTGEGFRSGLEAFASQPFRLVPYFAPEVWGGQWMKEVCGLDRDVENYAWAFDGVPEENSIYMRFGDVRMEFPSIDVVFYRPGELLGQQVYARFGDEFPIRFDFLDTMGGQNLSLQVHPLTAYIQHTFGMHYTQDESYYIMDCDDNAVVYLGLKEDADQEDMQDELRRAQETGVIFDAKQYVNIWPVKKHDHFLIPAGTIHCSGKNTMVLEISATPYIFTFKLWDWGRLGLDGKPRPVHLEHGMHVIQWERRTAWVKENLINRIEKISEKPGFGEERTGLHEREFIETCRYYLENRQIFNGGDSVSMCNVVEGSGAIITSPEGLFEPYEVHYAETFIIPASVLRFAIEPLEKSCMILRAVVR